MSPSRIYPDDVAGPYEPPPCRFEDREGRDIEVARYAEADFEATVAMYLEFHPEDRAQGIPPTGERRVREWIEGITAEGTDVVACHDGRVVGHATLVPDGSGAYELAIFVLRAYQEAGIGTHLIETLLGAGRAADIEHVWLTVERWNTPAIKLYEKVGFEASETGGFELEMSARLH
jgi:RimJ/RimL family protein N-acetyltransferase